MRPKILVVDDDASNAGALCELLAADGFDPIQFVSAEAAWHALAERSVAPDAVVADIRMPVLDGVAFLRRVKAHFVAMPVVLVSAFPEDAVWQEGLRAGAFDIFAKPIQGASLVRTLRKAVGTSRADARLGGNYPKTPDTGATKRRMGE
jgi:DNA-binding NtrC family response regulator